MPRYRSLVGLKFNRLTVVSREGRTPAGKHVWRCKCDCGAFTSVPGGSLVSGNTTSCGCYLKERITKHGSSDKSSYHTWRAMMRRCHTLHDKDYPRWGGKGIVVCDAWHTYARFAADMGEPVGVQTLDRIDTYGDYTPDNCRWASPTAQARNKRSNPGKSGHTGIYATSNDKWMAAISVARKKYYGKCRDTLEEALADRKELERLHWGEET